MTRYRNRLLPVLLPLLLVGCFDLLGLGDDGPDLGDAELRVAFVGNSLTFTHNVPGMVQALADADGRSMSHVSITHPNVSLSDHWYMGTPDVLRELEPDVVVMQQGPSTRPESREHLVDWSREYAAMIRGWGGEPALSMAWPAVQYFDYIPAVWASYKMAAEVVDGLFIPAGQTLAEARAIDPGIDLFGPDGFHQSELGALAVAQTVYAVLFDLPADSVPEWGGVDAETAAVLRAALVESLAKADTMGVR